MQIPLATNGTMNSGTETSIKVSVSMGVCNLRYQWIAVATTAEIPVISALCDKRCGTRPSKKRGRRNTVIAPAVMPNIVIEMATNAKWYIIVTLKIRVSRICNVKVASAIRKIPA